MVRVFPTQLQFVVLLMLIVNEIYAQMRCPPAWAYVCEGDKRRALNVDTRSRPQDIHSSLDEDRETVDGGSRSPDDSTHNNDDLPDWFWKLLAKSRQSHNGNNLEDIDQSSQPVSGRLTAKRLRTANDSEHEDRRLRLHHLARLLVAVDDLRRRTDYDNGDLVGRELEVRGDGGRPTDDDENRPSSVSRLTEIERTQEAKDAAARKELLSKWLREVLDV